VTIGAVRLRRALLLSASVAVCCPSAGWAQQAGQDDVTAAAVASESQTASAGGPQAAGPPAWAYSLAYDLMSPFCPGRTLAACPSPQAGELRQWILLQAVAGRSRDDIEQSLYDRYGDEILSAPRAEGWGLSAYVVPGLAFVIGGGLVAWTLRRLVGRAPESVTDPPSSIRGAEATARRSSSPSRDAELERLVDEELSRL
jgi:cytochrome c-type biogenesis protein CcmH/NrfF